MLIFFKIYKIEYKSIITLHKKEHNMIGYFKLNEKQSV